jgi:hypothetical protein
MSYVPPSKRNETKKKDPFKKDVDVDVDERPPAFVSSKAKSKSEPKPEINVEEEYFPTLGEATVKTKPETDLDPKFSFASSLTTPVPKVEVVKEVADGWVHIRKDKEPKFLFSEVMPESLRETYELIDELERIKCENAKYRLLDNYERYKEEDENKFGSPIIYSWQIDDYLKEQEFNKKMERLEMEDNLDIDDSSEDDYNEFNS